MSSSPAQLARPDASLKRDHETYRSLPERKRARRLKKATAAVDHPESTCPQCRYDIGGIFEDDDSPKPCPKCGTVVSPAIAVMGWWRKRRAYNRDTCIAAFSGLVQAALAWIYILLAGLLGGALTKDAFLILWILGFAVNAIVLPISIWNMQRETSPDRHPVVAAVASVLGALGSLASTWIFFFLIPLLAVYLFGG